MHSNSVIHRDLKTSNILIAADGTLKIGDWGLARQYSPDARLTTSVITLWYRPPELLLGLRNYTPAVDVWSVGCVICEMYQYRAIMQGRDEREQLDRIFDVVGTPVTDDVGQVWPDWENAREGFEKRPGRVREALRQSARNQNWITSELVRLATQLLALDHRIRLTAKDAHDMEFFFENPVVKKAENLDMSFRIDSVHELEARNRKRS